MEKETVEALRDYQEAILELAQEVNKAFKYLKVVEESLSETSLALGVLLSKIKSHGE